MGSAPLFDRYEVDLVLSGHDHHYERSYPVRGFDSGTGHPRPVTTVDSGVFDTSQGTVHLILGYGIAVFDVNPGTEAGGQTSITVAHYHAVGADPVNPMTGQPGAPAGDYPLSETFTLVRPRSDGRRWHAKQPSSVTVAAGQAPPSVRDNGFG